MKLRDIYFVYIEYDGLKAIISIEDGNRWEFNFVRGDEDLSIDGIEEFDDQYNIDDIMDYIHGEFDYVEEIEYSAMDEYIKEK
jgi:hypothetical protein